MKKTYLLFLIAALLILGWILFRFNKNIQKEDEKIDHSAAQSCEELVKYTKLGAETSFLTECNRSINKACKENRDCGSFPCVNNICLIRYCTSDSKCPNKKCGLHATPVPRFCTNIDII